MVICLMKICFSPNLGWNNAIYITILAFSRSTSFFYAYYVIRTLTAMVGEISINSLALAYVADHIPQGQRASAFGILSGVSTGASFVCGTLATRFLSTTSTFQVATLFSMIAVVYMRVFLKESLPHGENGSTQPILKGEPEDNQTDKDDSPRKIWEIKNIPSVRDVTSLLKSSVTLSQAAVVAFFSSLADGGMQASLLYFLKAQFHFNKDQFADLMLIVGVAGMFSQLLFMPFLAPVIAERKLLSIGLFAGCIHMLISSIAWATWVPYAITAFGVFAAFGPPSLRSIVSKQVGAHEQGKAQGCISGISSLATIISPLIFSPLTALFLSDGAPFYYPGFSIMGIGLALMIAFIQSLMIRDAPTSMSQNQYCTVEEA
ncbi:hippocampus abundant transcript-like protein 1 isoform X2 [Mangifera indica]|uniref:hippocampus abundant transcript-like protein 1 isoform X2 n=1 Tax=Mangifera indica TaxID=29780 RepID=UPI001CFC3126|nr:hippocampus abundant transcript-like protein 1 isoform X2 [Mangifera indica]